jgi:hypothetical protein
MPYIPCPGRQTEPQPADCPNGQPSRFTPRHTAAGSKGVQPLNAETATEIRAQYTVDERGRITNPGKFEGQPIYVPYYWDSYLNGCADRDDGRVLGFDITPEDRALFPEIPSKRRTIKLEESDSGFVTSDH